MKTVTLEQLLQLHVLVIQASGGSDGLRDLGRLEATLAAQTQEVFGEALYSGVFEKAAALCKGVVGGHPFVDGNERTAMLLATTFMELNGHEFNAKKGELEDFVVKVAVDHLDVPVIAAWLKAHSKKAPNK